MLNLVPQSDCAQAREAVSARLDSELPELDGARLDAHLRACAECRAYAAEIQTITVGLRAVPLEWPEIRVIMPRRRRVPIQTAAAAAAAVVLAAIAGSSFALGRAFNGHGAATTDRDRGGLPRGARGCESRAPAGSTARLSPGPGGPAWPRHDDLSPRPGIFRRS